MKMHTDRHHQEAKLLPPDTFLIEPQKMRLRPGGAYNAPPDPLAGNGGGPPLGRGGERRGGGGGMGREGEGLSPRTKILATALCLRVCLSPSVCLYVCLSVCLFLRVCSFVCWSVRLSYPLC